MNANWNWLEDVHRHADEPDRAQAMPVFSGHKLVVVGGSSGMGRQTAADVVAAGGTAVIIDRTGPRQRQRHRQDIGQGRRGLRHHRRPGRS